MVINVPYLFEKYESKCEWSTDIDNWSCERKRHVNIVLWYDQLQRSSDGCRQEHVIYTDAYLLGIIQGWEANVSRLPGEEDTQNKQQPFVTM